MIEEGEAQARFRAYVAAFAQVLGHADRIGPFRDYCLGLLMPGARKSVEPMAGVTAPARVGAQHQSLLHFVGQGGWSDERVLAKVRDLVLPAIEQDGGIAAWIVGESRSPKRGTHSVGVARQRDRGGGRQDNCQVAVVLSVCNQAAGLPIGYELYLPEAWALDPERRRKAGVPADVAYETRARMAFRQMRSACAAGVPRGVVLIAAHHHDADCPRSAISGLGLRYVAAVTPTSIMGIAGDAGVDQSMRDGPQACSAWRRAAAGRASRTVKDLALALPSSAWTQGPSHRLTVLALTGRPHPVRGQAAMHSPR